MRSRTLPKTLLVVGLAIPTGGLLAQTPTPRPAPCSAPEYRQFDFWVGNWNVYSPDGQLQGTNDVTREYEGCVVQEHWIATVPPAQRGSSFNTWSPGARHWHQTWVDSTGGFLLLDGEFKDGVMTLAGDTPDPKGGAARDRIAWSKLPGGKVRQLWERSKDGGKTWSLVFDGTYVPKK
jgi:hypothetical protein